MYFHFRKPPVMSRTVSVKAEIRSGFFSAVNIAFTDVLERPEVFANFE